MADVDNSNIKLEIYTSNFATVFNKNKPIIEDKTEDYKISIATHTKPFYKCDEYFGKIFGAYNIELEEYEEHLKELDKDGFINDFVNLLSIDNFELDNKDTKKFRIFLLCYENIDNKSCHRTILKDYLNKKFPHLNIREFNKE